MRLGEIDADWLAVTVICFSMVGRSSKGICGGLEANSVGVTLLHPDDEA